MRRYLVPFYLDGSCFPAHVHSRYLLTSKIINICSVELPWGIKERISTAVNSRPSLFVFVQALREVPSFIFSYATSGDFPVHVVSLLTSSFFSQHRTLLDHCSLGLSKTLGDFIYKVIVSLVLPVNIIPRLSSLLPLSVTKFRIFYPPSTYHPSSAFLHGSSQITLADPRVLCLADASKQLPFNFRIIFPAHV